MCPQSALASALRRPVSCTVPLCCLLHVACSMPLCSLLHVPCTMPFCSLLHVCPCRTNFPQLLIEPAPCTAPGGIGAQPLRHLAYMARFRCWASVTPGLQECTSLSALCQPQPALLQKLTPPPSPPLLLTRMLLLLLKLLRKLALTLLAGVVPAQQAAATRALAAVALAPTGAPAEAVTATRAGHFLPAHLC